MNTVVNAISTDDQLIHAIAGHGKDFEKAASLLFDRYAQKLIGFYVNRGFDVDAADDLLQETLLKFVNSVVEKRGECSIGLLWSIAKSTAVDFIRSRHAQKRDVNSKVSLDATVFEIPSDDAAQDSELSDCVDMCVRLFDAKWPEHSVALKLAIFEEWNMQELAEFLGRTSGATRQYVSECRKKLRTLVIEHCSEFIEYANG